MCASCGQGIYDGQYLQALNADWHADCFRWDPRGGHRGDSGRRGLCPPCGVPRGPGPASCPPPLPSRGVRRGRGLMSPPPALPASSLSRPPRASSSGRRREEAGPGGGGSGRGGLGVAVPGRAVPCRPVPPGAARCRRSPGLRHGTGSTHREKPPPRTRRGLGVALGLPPPQAAQLSPHGAVKAGV